MHSSGVNQGTIPPRMTGRVKLVSTTGCIIFTQSPHSIIDVLTHSLLRSESGDDTSDNDRSRNSTDNIITPSLLLILLLSQYYHNEIMLRCCTCLQSLIVCNPWLFHSNETVDLHRELFHSNPWLGSNCAYHEPPWTILLPATSNTIITSTTGCIIFTQSPHSIFDVLIHSLLRSAVQSNRKRKGALDSAPAEAPKKKRRKKKRRKKKGPRKCNIRRRDDLPATRLSHTDIPLSERDIEKVREWA